MPSAQSSAGGTSCMNATTQATTSRCGWTCSTWPSAAACLRCSQPLRISAWPNTASTAGGTAPGRGTGKVKSPQGPTLSPPPLRGEDHSILWRRLDRPGHESSRLFPRGTQWNLTGTAVFANDDQPCRLDYMVLCDSRWQTFYGKISGWAGSQTVEVELSVDSDHRWRLNGAECPAVAGRLDLRLNFRRSTSLGPIRRVRLAARQQGRVPAPSRPLPVF